MRTRWISNVGLRAGTANFTGQCGFWSMRVLTLWLDSELVGRGRSLLAAGELCACARVDAAAARQKERPARALTDRRRNARLGLDGVVA